MTNEDKAKLIYSITGDVERYLQAIKDDKPNHSPDVGEMAVRYINK